MKVSTNLVAEQTRKCVELRAQGVTINQIAKKLGISYPTAKKRLVEFYANRAVAVAVDNIQLAEKNPFIGEPAIHAEDQNIPQENPQEIISPPAEETTMSFTPDYDQLKLMTKDQVVMRIREIGADVHPSESKTDLIGRLLQLQGTAQPIDKIRKELEAHGVGEDGVSTVAIPLQKQRLTIPQMKEAMKKFIDKGMKFRVSKDGETWEMSYICDQLEQGGKILKAQRINSGNTLMPLSVLKQCAESIMTVNVYRKRNINAPEGFVEVADSENTVEVA